MINTLFTSSIANQFHDIVRKAVAAAYQKNISPFTLNSLRLHHELNEALDICIIHVLSKASKYNPNKGSLEGWIYRVCFNKCRDLQRKKRPKVVHFDETHQKLEEQCFQDVMATEIEWEHTFQIVENSLNEMKPLSKNVYLYRFMDELTHEEIAKKTGLKSSSVGQTLHRAKKELNTLIELNRNISQAA